MRNAILIGSKYLPGLIRFSFSALWAMAAFLSLAPSLAFGKEHNDHGQRALALMGPTGLAKGARTAGDDIYLYEDNAKTYLYVEQDSGKHLLVLHVTNPERQS